jgi:hypothetical protein
MGASKFAELVAAKSSGRINIHVAHSEQLGSENTNMSSIRTGTLDLGSLGQGALLLQHPDAAEQPFYRLAPQWAGVRVRMLDRASVVKASTIHKFTKIGWSAEPISGEALEWLSRQRSPVAAVVANLFIHHFTQPDLEMLLAEIASRANVFVAVEPRRARLPLLASSLLWATGCNAVTRHDARKSVRAGFVGSELSNLWPASPDWASSLILRAGASPRLVTTTSNFAKPPTSTCSAPTRRMSTTNSGLPAVSCGFGGGA